MYPDLVSGRYDPKNRQIRSCFHVAPRWSTRFKCKVVRRVVIFSDNTVGHFEVSSNNHNNYSTTTTASDNTTTATTTTTKRNNK